MASLVLRSSRAAALLQSEARRWGDLEMQNKQSGHGWLAEKFQRAQMRQVRRNAFVLMVGSGDVPVYPSWGMPDRNAIHLSTVMPAGAMEGPAYLALVEAACFPPLQ
jgi:hypothetical protein